MIPPRLWSSTIWCVRVAWWRGVKYRSLAYYSLHHYVNTEVAHQTSYPMTVVWQFPHLGNRSARDLNMSTRGVYAGQDLNQPLRTSFSHRHGWHIRSWFEKNPTSRGR